MEEQKEHHMALIAIIAIVAVVAIIAVVIALTPSSENQVGKALDVSWCAKLQDDCTYNSGCYDRDGAPTPCNEEDRQTLCKVARDCWHKIFSASAN